MNDDKEKIINVGQKAADILNLREHATMLSIPILNGLNVENNNNPQSVLVASGNGLVEQLTADGFIEDGTFERRIEAVINNTKQFMESNGLENVNESFIYFKDYTNGIFNFKLYMCDMIIPVDNEKKIIRQLNAYFVEPKMKDFYQLSLAAGPFVMPVETLKPGIIDLQNDNVTISLVNSMQGLMDNLKYRDN